MNRPTCRVFLLAVASLAFSAPSSSAHSGGVIGAGSGTPILDGFKAPGEWDAADPRQVFTGLSGSMLYVLLDDTNLYLALWVPDATLTINDQFRVRIDGDHDGLNTQGDDELGITGTGLFFDLHYDSGFWNQGDPYSHGSARVGPLDGGSFYELAHPLDSGDPFDISASSGDTIGLCIRYNNLGVTNAADVYPTDCMNSVYQQSHYVDVVLGGSTVDAGASSPAAGALEVLPNPAVPGAPLEVRFEVAESGAEIDLGLYSVTGARVAGLAHGAFAGGRQSVRWVPRSAGSPRLGPGVYFLRLRQNDGPVQTRAILLR